jgi:hypothetical protein
MRTSASSPPLVLELRRGACVVRMNASSPAPRSRCRTRRDAPAPGPAMPTRTPRTSTIRGPSSSRCIPASRTAARRRLVGLVVVIAQHAEPASSAASVRARHAAWPGRRTSWSPARSSVGVLGDVRSPPSAARGRSRPPRAGRRSRDADHSRVSGAGVSRPAARPRRCAARGIGNCSAMTRRFPRVARPSAPSPSRARSPTRACDAGFVHARVWAIAVRMRSAR